MKILVVGNASITKSSSEFLTHKPSALFLKAISDIGHDVSLFQFHTSTRTKNESLNDYPLSSSIRILSTEIQKSNSFMKMVYYTQQLINALVILRKYDFIYIFYPGHTPTIIALLCTILQKKYGLYIRGQHQIDSFLGRSLISKAFFCLTVSSLLKEKITLSNPNVDIIAPMMEFNEDDIIETEPPKTNQHLIRCLYVGRVERRKGVYELADAIIRLNNDGIQFTFDIVGDGEDLKNVKKSLAQISGISFHGQISDAAQLKRLYSSCEVFVFPTHDEGFPRVLYEAMMYQALVLTTMVGGIPAIMKDGYNCLEILPKESKSIYERLIEVSSYGFESGVILENATDTVKNIFNGSRKSHIKLFSQKLEEIF